MFLEHTAIAVQPTGGDHRRRLGINNTEEKESQMLRLLIVTGLLIGFAGTSAMACPDNLASGSNCVTELDTNPAGAPDPQTAGGDHEPRERPEKKAVCLWGC